MNRLNTIQFEVISCNQYIQVADHCKSIRYIEKCEEAEPAGNTTISCLITSWWSMTTMQIFMQDVIYKTRGDLPIFYGPTKSIKMLLSRLKSRRRRGRRREWRSQPCETTTAPSRTLDLLGTSLAITTPVWYIKAIITGRLIP